MTEKSDHGRFTEFWEAILANPQPHIDALVEAEALEVVEITAGEGMGGTYYRVVQPHKHEVPDE